MAAEGPFLRLRSKRIAGFASAIRADPSAFPSTRYDEDGSNRRENITDWALNEFRTHYNDPNITKWDIFHYVYAVLHHPEYRERYAANLKRELPRIPFVGAAGQIRRRAGLQASVQAASGPFQSAEGQRAAEGGAPTKKPQIPRLRPHDSERLRSG